MTQTYRLKSLSTIILASTLFACGDGSDGGNPNNSDAASKYTGKTSLAGINADNAYKFSNGILELQRFFTLDESLSSDSVNIAGVQYPLNQAINITENCQTGSFTLENNLNNGVGSLSLGLNDCYYEEASNAHKYNGKVSVEINSADTKNIKKSYFYTYDNYEENIESLAGNFKSSSFSHGEISVTQENNHQKVTSNALIKFMYQVDGKSFSGNSLTQSLTITKSTNDNGIMEYSYSGNYYEGDYGKVTINTLTPFTFDIESEVISGSFELTGNNNSKVKLVAENYVSILHIDADGDGSYETKITYTMK